MLEKMIIVAGSVNAFAQGSVALVKTRAYQQMARQALETPSLDPRVRKLLNLSAMSLAIAGLAGRVSAQTFTAVGTKVNGELTSLQGTVTTIAITVCVLAFLGAIIMLALKQRGAIAAGVVGIIAAMCIPAAKLIPALAK